MKMPSLGIKRLGLLLIYLSIVSVILRADARLNSELLKPVQEPFDRYGEIAWNDEKARLDNFAIQLLQEPDYVGCIFVFNAPSMCSGEAQARAVRAKRYIVERRGVPWNRVMWKEEGYREEAQTIMWIFKPNVALSFHMFDYEQPSQVSYAVKKCKARIAQIKSSKW